MHSLAAASSSGAIGIWAYLVVFIPAACIVLARVHYRRHQARRSTAGLQPQQHLVGSGD
jgi:hypothetical protein